MFRIVGQILVKNGHAVQCDNFSDIYSLGEFKNAVKSLEALEPDEINIMDLDGNISLTLKDNLPVLKSLRIPISVGGGVDLGEIHSYPVERYLINSLLFESDVSHRLDNFKQGRQSLIGYLPFKEDRGVFQYFNSTKGVFLEVGHRLLSKIFDICSEVIFLDTDHQGNLGRFNSRFPNSIPREYLMRSYLSGGICPDNLSLFRRLGCAGVVLDNSSLYWQQKIYKR